MNCVHESLHDTRIVMDNLGQGSEQLVVQKAFLTILQELFYLWFTLITVRETSSEGAGMMILLVLPLKWAPAFSMVVKIPVDIKTYLAPSTYLMLVGSCSWKMEVDFPLMTSFLFLALAVSLTCHGWNHTGTCRHAVEVNEGVTDGNSIHFARVKNTWWTSAQYVQIHLLQPSLPYLRDAAALHKTRCSCLSNRDEQRDLSRKVGIPNLGPFL